MPSSSTLYIGIVDFNWRFYWHTQTEISLSSLNLRLADVGRHPFQTLIYALWLLLRCGFASLTFFEGCACSERYVARLLGVSIVCAKCMRRFHRLLPTIPLSLQLLLWLKHVVVWLNAGATKCYGGAAGLYSNASMEALCRHSSIYRRTLRWCTDTFSWPRRCGRLWHWDQARHDRLVLMLRRDQVILRALLRKFVKHKVKCESKNTKVITWQHWFVNNIMYENILFCWEWTILTWFILHVFQLLEFRGVLLTNTCYW
jgi:hypothetical protein